MRLTIFLLLFIHNLAFSAEALDGLTLVNGCRLFNVAGNNFKNFPGAMCLFLDDGRLISASENALRVLNKNNEVLWEIKGHFHHQMNLTTDKKILILSSAASSETGKNYRQDKIMVIDYEGKVLHEKLMTDIYKLSKTDPIALTLDPHLRPLFGFGNEISHLNSIYEIPQNSSKHSYLKKGNIIINGLESGIQILSPDLSKVLYHAKLKSSVLHAIHDAQVTSKGHFLVFNNAVATEKKRNVTHPNWRAFSDFHSAINEIDPSTLEVLKKFEANPAQMFYSRACGSVQELDSDTWLFTHIITGTYVYSSKTKKMLHSIPATHMNEHQFIPVQQVKALDLNKFLSHWK